MNDERINPFRNALITFNLLPDHIKPAFLTAFNDDWADLEHNGNPLEHIPAENQDMAMAYTMEWAGWALDSDIKTPYRNDPETTRVWLTRMADAFDLIPELPEPDETTFAGDHVATGYYIDADIPTTPYSSKAPLGIADLPDKFTLTLDDNIIHMFHVEGGTVVYDGLHEESGLDMHPDHTDPNVRPYDERNPFHL
jgi:hypothetical protein